MAQLEFTPANPNDVVEVHSPEGEIVKCSIANASDLVRLNGYFWKAEEAVAVAAAKASEAEEKAAKATEEKAAKATEAGAEANAEATKAEITDVKAKSKTRKTGS